MNDKVLIDRIRPEIKKIVLNNVKSNPELYSGLLTKLNITKDISDLSVNQVILLINASEIYTTRYKLKDLNRIFI